MANEIILVDTSILIDFYRKTDKANSVWVSLIRKGYEFSICLIKLLSFLNSEINVFNFPMELPEYCK